MLYQHRAIISGEIMLMLTLSYSQMSKTRNSLSTFTLTTDIFLKLHTFVSKVRIIKQNFHKTYGWKKTKIQQ